MLKERLKKYNIILASGSPRRQSLLKELNIDFKIEVREIEESYSEKLQAAEITDYLSKLKASAFDDLSNNELLITSDTIVWKNNRAIGKPKNLEDAKKMLGGLSDGMHEVITSVCFTTTKFQRTINDVTKVYFKELSISEIDYYLKNYKPFDKAGSYGIQEWIGYIAITRLEGSYFNVMGLPIHKVYKVLSSL